MTLDDHIAAAQGLSPRRRGRPPVYPLREMRPGDSLYLAGVNRHVVASSACQVARRVGDGCRYTTEAVQGGVIVRRVA